MTFPETIPIQPFLSYLTFQKRYSQHTIISYKNDLLAFNGYLQEQFGDTAINEISSSFVRSWLASLKEAGMESRSINRKISTLKSFFKFQLKQGSVDTSPMASIVSPKSKKRLPQFVDEKGTAILFNNVVFAEDWTGQTHRLVMELLYNTGMRQAELAGLKESHIDSSNQQIKVLGKGNKERIIPVSGALLELTQAYIRSKRKLLDQFDDNCLLVTASGKPLYPRYIYNTVRKYLTLPEVTTIDKRSPHVLRHTFATHLMNGGADINAVKELLGHSSLAATQIYTHNTIEKLKEVHRKAHPKA